MSRVKPLILSGVVLNLLLVPASLVSTPRSASAFFHNPPEQYDCCKTEQGTGKKFCCDQCCPGGEDCDSSGDCGAAEME